MANILTQKTVKILGIAGLVVVALGGGTIVGQPMLNKITTQQTELADVKAQLDVMEANKAALQQAKDQYPTVQQINKDLLAQFPELAEVRELLDVITLSAESSGINASNISSVTFANPAISTPPVAPVTDTAAPAAPGGTAADNPAEPAPAADTTTTASGGEFATMEVGIAINGSETQLRAFLDALNTMDRAMLIKGFSIANSGGEGASGQKALSLTGTVFIYKAIPGPEDATQPAPTDTTTTGGATPAPTTP